MAKYKKFSKQQEPDATPTMLYFIANELAEANRLKRLELQTEYFKDKELEDKA